VTAPAPLRRWTPSADGGDRLAVADPEVQLALRGLDGAVWLDPRLRELVAARTAQLNGCLASLARHSRAAVELGETHARLAALSRWRRSALFDARERAALALADALALLPGAERLDRSRRAAARHFGARELAQLVFVCATAGARDRLELASGGG